MRENDVLLYHVTNQGNYYIIGHTLKLDRDKMPTLLYRFMRPGLIWNMDDRDLDLTETWDMLLVSRRRRQKNVSEGSNYDDIKFDQERHHRKNSKSEKEERKM